MRPLLSDPKQQFPSLHLALLGTPIATTPLFSPLKLGVRLGKAVPDNHHYEYPVVIPQARERKNARECWRMLVFRLGKPRGSFSRAGQLLGCDWIRGTGRM